MSHLNELLAQNQQADSANTDFPTHIRLLRLCFHWFCKGLYKLYCPLNVSGRDNLPREQFIICSNHCSHMDTTALIYATKLPRQRFAAMAAQDYFFDTDKIHFSRYLMNLIPVSRNANRKNIIHCLRACRAHTTIGRNLIIYPEGTRSITGEMRIFKNGAALIAAQLGLPIVPAYIDGTYQALPKNHNVIKPHKINITFGHKIETKALADAKNHKIYVEITKQLTVAINTLKEQQHAK